MILVALAAALLSQTDASAQAKSKPKPKPPPRSGPCLPGQAEPRCTYEYGRAPYGATDGDTIPVRIDGQRFTSRVRVTGVQAMELTNYQTLAGECRAAEATRRAGYLIKRAKGRVRLAGLGAGASSRKRPLRSVAVRVGGRWRDIGDDLISRGLAIRLNHTKETYTNLSYSRRSESAQRRGVGLFDPNGCGGGYQAGLPIQLWVSADPPGADIDQLDDEFVVVRNLDAAQTLDLSSWWVRDSGLRRYTFAPGTAVAPGQAITVRVDSGEDTPTERWWGLKNAVFDNPTAPERGAQGDGAYLFDPEGDVRAAMQYPCRSRCGDPLAGQLELTVKPTRQERITVTNRAAGPVNLYGYRLRSRKQLYHFRSATVLEPGAALTVDVQGYPEDDEPGRVSWGQVARILPDRGGAVRLENYADVTVTCSAWGTGAC